VSDVNEKKMQHFALIENIQRDELNAIELAHAYRELMKVYDATHDELAKVVHKSRTHITNMLRLLQLSNDSQEALVNNIITAGHAKVMIGLSDKEQEVVLNSIVGQKLSVREVETLVKQLKAKNTTPNESKKIKNSPSFNLKNITAYLQDLGYKTSSKSNKITIEFANEDEVKKFISHLQ